MIRIELEVSVPHVSGLAEYARFITEGEVAERSTHTDGRPDSLGVAGLVSSALLEAMGSRGYVVHAVRVEEMDA